MYHDRANVYRAEKVKNGKTDDYERQFKLIYEKMPCHLAQYGKELSAHRDDSTQNITEDLRLSYSPEYEILENDVLEVQHQGQIFKLIAGTTFKYATHVELSARRRKEAKQQ
jgi:hypothetical protein